MRMFPMFLYSIRIGFLIENGMENGNSYTMISGYDMTNCLLIMVALPKMWKMSFGCFTEK